jgi:hypothetical protein
MRANRSTARRPPELVRKGGVVRRPLLGTPEPVVIAVSPQPGVSFTIDNPFETLRGERESGIKPRPNGHATLERGLLPRDGNPLLSGFPSAHKQGNGAG